MTDIYSQNLKSDFAIFFEMIINESEIKREALKPRYQIIHERIYNFKEIINLSNTTTTIAHSYLLETLNGLIDVTDLLSKNRYKLASTILRNTLETFAKYLVNENHLLDQEGFSNNFDSGSSALILKYITQVLNQARNKNLRKCINHYYVISLKDIYWKLCDIVHARDTTYNECNEYLETIRNASYDEVKFEKVFNLFLTSLDKMTVLLYLQNAKFLLENANQIKLDYLLLKFDENFSEIRSYV